MAGFTNFRAEFIREGLEMNQHGKVKINQLASGVIGLDDILGGGIPEFSFNIIAGSPGCGKTTLAHQFVFKNATIERPALYFTVLGEPALKMLRYQQQYSFFDPAKLGTAVRFVNLSQQLLEGGLHAVLEEITKQVEATDASIVVVDSFRTVVRQENGDRVITAQAFVQQLALLLTSCEATTFLIGEYSAQELADNPVFTVPDGLFWLYQQVERNSVVRKLQVMKLRGQMSVPGMHTYRITSAGLQAFSRTLGLVENKKRIPEKRRLSTGVQALDEMMGGGIPEGDSLLVTGSSGTGKSLLATQFIAAGLRAGESGIVAVFEERPDDYVSRAATFGLDLDTALTARTLAIIYLRPLDLSVDEMMQELIDAVKRTGAKRLVIDSLAGFELALAPGFRTDFRESLYRMIFALTGIGITILSTLEMEESFTKFPFSSYLISFLTDDIIRMRYVEVAGQLRKILTVVKMRGSAHSKDIRTYEIAPNGIELGGRLSGFEHLITGIPDQKNSTSGESRRNRDGPDEVRHDDEQSD
jgi:circadian clock protein KaiC